MTRKSPEEHAQNWDLRHEDFKDNEFLYDVYSAMRQQSPFAHTDSPFLSATPGGAWVAVRYEECYKILQDWQHFSSNPTPEASEQLAGRHLRSVPRQFGDPGIPQPSRGVQSRREISRMRSVVHV